MCSRDRRRGKLPTIILMVLLAMLTPCWLFASLNPGNFTQIYFQEGLRSDWIFDIARDSLGFMWFAGHTGLTRYDGRASKHFYADPSSSGSLSENQVFRLLVASKDEIFCSTIGGGINILDVNTGTFQQIDLGDQPDHKFASTGLKINDSLFIFLVGRNRQLFVLQRKGDEFHHHSIPLRWATEKADFQENKARDIFRDPRNEQLLWIVGNFRLFTYHLGTSKLTMVKEFEFPSGTSRFFEMIMAVEWMDDDHLIMNLRGKGFSKFNVRTHQLEQLFADPDYPEYTSVIEKSASGIFWLGSKLGRLYKYYPEENKLERISLFPHDINKFSIESILETPHGILYIGTMGQGVFKYNPWRNAFRVTALADLMPQKIDFISSGEIHPFEPIYYFTRVYANGVYKYHLEDNTISMVQGSGIPDTNRKNLVRWQNADFLTHNGSQVFKIVAKENRLMPFSIDGLDSILQDKNRKIRWIITSPENTLFVMGEDYMFLCFAGEKYYISDLRKRSDVNLNIYNGAIIEQNRVLLHDEDHIYDWDFNSDQINKLEFNDPEIGKLVKSIRRIVPFRNYYYLSTAMHGIFRISIKNDTLFDEGRLTAPSTLLSNNCYAASMDGDSVIWISTGLGIVRYDPVHRSMINYSYEQNLPILYQDRTMRFNHAGYYAINTSEHFIWSKKEDLSPEGITSKIVVNSLSVNGDEMVSGILVSDVDPLVMPHNKNNVRIAWSHLAPLPLSYFHIEYRLDNFDETWKQSEDFFSANYTNLPPGKYTFRIRATNLHAETENASFTLSVILLPPYWATTWFRVLFILFVMGIAYLIFRLKIDNIKSKERIKTEYNKRLAELELANLRSQMNPHFMFNSLNSIKHYILKNEKERAADYLSNFAQLIRDILNYSNAETIYLADEIKTLKRYIELEQMRFSKGFESVFYIDPSIDVCQIKVQPLIFQPYVENAIWHGLMHKPDNRKLTIRFQYENNKLICQIEDNGIGRKQAELIRSKSATKKSYGMRITQSRMQQRDKEARVELTDLTDNHGNAMGTLVTITLPYAIIVESIA
jgi:hypothetical protein